MGYGATYSDDQRGGRPKGTFERGLADWRALQDHPDIAVHVDTGGRASAHRRDTLVVATDDLRDRRLTDNLSDLGVTKDDYDAARRSSRRVGLGFATLPLGTGQDVVGAATFLRALGGRRPLRVGPDHVLWPMQGRVLGPAMPPRKPATSPSTRTSRAQASRAKEFEGPVPVAVLDSGYVEGDPLTDVCTDTFEPDTRWDPAAAELDHWIGAHGTHVAGVLATASGGAARIRHYNVARAFGDRGLPLVADSDLAAAVAAALTAGCRILNLSLGGPTALDLGLAATSLVVGRAAGRKEGRGLQGDDAVIVAAAGNEATTQPMYPAALCGVVAVGAMDAKGGRADFSNYGSWVDCATAGVDVLGPHVRGNGALMADGTQEQFDGWALWSGSSFAAPFVAGRIAAAMAGSTGIPSARVAAATVLSNGSPLDPALGLGVAVS